MIPCYALPAVFLTTSFICTSCLLPTMHRQRKALCAEGAVIKSHQLLSWSGTLHQLGVDWPDGTDPSLKSSVVEKPSADLVVDSFRSRKPGFFRGNAPTERIQSQHQFTGWKSLQGPFDLFEYAFTFFVCLFYSRLFPAPHQNSEHKIRLGTDKRALYTQEPVWNLLGLFVMQHFVFYSFVCVLKCIKKVKYAGRFPFPELHSCLWLPLKCLWCVLTGFLQCCQFSESKEEWQSRYADMLFVFLLNWGSDAGVFSYLSLRQLLCACLYSEWSLRWLTGRVYLLRHVQANSVD